MGIELNIAEEFATISVAATETASIKGIISSEITKQEFSLQFNRLIEELARCLDVISQHLSPFAALDTESAFMDRFDELYTAYSDCYLAEVSKPRQYSAEAYEHYLVLKTFRECKTQFPLLKRVFERLDKLVDKWLTNDAWLAMSIDNLLKRQQRLLTEVAEMKKKDPSDAFLILSSAYAAFDDYLNFIAKKREQLRVKPVMDSHSEYKVI